MRSIPAGILTKLKSKVLVGGDAPTGYIEFPEILDDGVPRKLKVDSIRISRDETADAQSLFFTIPNVNPTDPTDLGYYTPLRSTEFGKTENEWKYAIIPSRKVQVKLGYGSDIDTVFTGEIDDVDIDSDPKHCVIKVNARDMAAMLIDQTVKITWNDTVEDYWIEYPLPSSLTSYYWLPAEGSIPDISDIVKDLCMRAGFDANDVIIIPTGLEYAGAFDNKTYKGCINELCDISGYKFYIDEDGKAYFVPKWDRQPVMTDEAKQLSGTDAVLLAKEHLVVGSVDVWSGQNNTGTHYTYQTDYVVNFTTGAIARTADSSIPDEAAVYVSYIYAAWAFQEGVDIFSLNLKMSRRGIYGTVAMRGAFDVYKYTNETLFDGCKIRRDKVLFVTNDFYDEQSQLETTVDRIHNDMSSRYITAEFAAVGNPWIQVGDSIMVIEHRSTISEVYQISEISHELSNGAYIAQYKVFHVGYTPN